jgi:hypothetical protein
MQVSRVPSREYNILVGITQRTLCVFLLWAASVASAAESETASPFIELSLGETAYVHLMSSTPTGRPVAAMRVDNPNRNYSIVKLTFETGENGGKHRLRVNNGYDHPIFFATMCPRSADLLPPRHVLVGAAPGREASVEVPLSITKLSLCDFIVSLGPVR